MHTDQGPCEELITCVPRYCTTAGRGQARAASHQVIQKRWTHPNEEPAPHGMTMWSKQQQLYIWRQIVPSFSTSHLLWLIHHLCAGFDNYMTVRSGTCERAPHDRTINSGIVHIGFPAMTTVCASLTCQL